MKRQLLFFHQDGCGPCKMMEPKVHALRSDDLHVSTIDVRHPDGLKHAQVYEVTSTPTLVLLNLDPKTISEDHFILDKHVGAMSMEKLKEFVGRT